jgi:hypothetical protein
MRSFGKEKYCGRVTFLFLDNLSIFEWLIDQTDRSKSGFSSELKSSFWSDLPIDQISLKIFYQCQWYFQGMFGHVTQCSFLG